MFCIAAGSAVWGGLHDDEPGLRLTIHETMPFADPDDDTNVLGVRYWDVEPRFSVEPRCAGLRLSAGRQIRYNGRAVGGADDVATAGDAILISAAARCRNGLRARAERLIELPTASCDSGPLRVFDMHGSATSYDWNHDDDPFPLRPGHLVAPGSPIEVSPGGWIEMGAPDCNLLRVRLFEGESTVGGYERGDRGDSFSGNRIFARADRHTGQFWVPGGPGDGARAMVTPLGGLTSYAVRAFSRRVVLRVYRGSAFISGGNEQRLRGVLVRAGQQSSVRCPGPCRPTAARVFQPREPWVYAEARGHARLAPRFATFETRRLPRAGGAPEQLLVAWRRSIRMKYATRDEQGLWVWERRDGRWHKVYGYRSPYGAYHGFDVGDVTGDGHHDVLIKESLGTAACGVRRLVAFAGGRTGELFARDFCEGGARILGGALRVQEAVGPCPYKEMSVHCRGGLRTTALRWDGARLISAKKTLRCNLARLDPARNCAPKR